MSRTLTSCAFALMLIGAGCADRVDVEKIPVGTQVQVTRQDGGVVSGKLVTRDDKTVTVAQGPAGRSVPRDQIADVRVLGDAPAPLPSIAKFREFAIPAGSTLPVRLEAAIGSDSSNAGDRVEATLTAPVIVDGTEVLPAGSAVTGTVTAARAAGKVKGRASLAVRFDSVAVAGRDEQYPVAARKSWQAGSTRRKDAATIAVPAAGGAIIGGLIGGKKGAAIGAAIGGGGGTAVVMTTSGPQVRLSPGATFSLWLERPVDVRVPIRKG